MKKILTWFAQGCLAVVPAGATLYVLWWLISSFDRLVGTSVPGLGIITCLTVITCIGFLVTNVLGRRFFRLLELVMTRVPLVSMLYQALRDVVEALVSERTTFGSPVAFQISDSSEIRLFGFQTRDSLQGMNLETHVAVYVPQAYNIGGQLLAVPKERVETLTIPPSELLSFMMSGGASGPKS
ncbi:MAG: DUF502 domain-containing protein [Polyangiaceae bacterium]|nr:DUF502 domain-containing protein [Polyangiaceae bacterium]